MDELVRRYPEGVKLVFKNYPLSMHPHAEVAAKAVIAARSQGKFWKLHEALFDPKLGELDPKAILRVAAAVGLDVKKLEADMASKAVLDVLAAEKAEAAALGLQGTPLVFINGREYDLGHFKLVSEGETGAVAAEDIDDWITLELKLNKGAPTKGPPQPAPSAHPASSVPVPAEPAPSASVPTRVESLRPAPAASAAP
jgi:protein-disulfide isomerase